MSDYLDHFMADEDDGIGTCLTCGGTRTNAAQLARTVEADPDFHPVTVSPCPDCETS